MESSILFVVNPVSGNLDKDSFIQSVEDWRRRNNIHCQFYKTTGKKDETQLKKKIEQSNIDIVAAVGGDGTVKLCAGLIKETEMKLAIIPAGSANGMATELQIPKSWEDALSLIQNGQSRAIDLLSFNNEELGLHISDLGLNAGLIKRYEESSYRGFMGYAQGIVDNLSNSQAFDIEIDTGKDETLVFTTYMVAIANARRYGTGALLNNVGQIDDGLFELCIFKDLDLLNIGKHFFDQISDSDPHMKVIQTSSATLSVKEGSSPFQIDGEYKGEKSKVDIKILPQCLHMIMPH